MADKDEDHVCIEGVYQTNTFKLNLLAHVLCLSNKYFKIELNCSFAKMEPTTRMKFKSVLKVVAKLTMLVSGQISLSSDFSFLNFSDRLQISENSKFAAF